MRLFLQKRCLLHCQAARGGNLCISTSWWFYKKTNKKTFYSVFLTKSKYCTSFVKFCVLETPTLHVKRAQILQAGTLLFQYGSSLHLSTPSPPPPHPLTIKFITFATEGDGGCVFTPFCLFVYRISQKAVDGSRWNFVDRLGVWQGRTD